MAYRVPDQTGRTFVITGANTGIGRVSAVSLAAAGAHVVLACRSLERTQPVLDEIGAERASFVPLDLASLASVRGAASQILGLDRPLHGLINNAGLAGRPGSTEDGFEITFGVNHLGHYLLTRLLLDRLRASSPSRIVNVASRAHYRSTGIDLDAQQRATATKTGLPEYSDSKLANVLFTRELAERLEATGVTAYSMHPGVVATDIWRGLPGPLEKLVKLFMISPEEGAETILYCATEPKLADTSGGYYARCAEKKPNALAEDAGARVALWDRSAAWVGLDP